MSAGEKKASHLDSLDQLDQAMMIDFEQVELVTRQFFEETNLILSEVDGLIIKLEQDPSDAELVNILFRKIHTIKGSVGAVPGGQLMGSVAHEFEAVLLNIKHGRQFANHDCINLFLKSSRILKVLTLALKEKRELYPEELSEAIELIANYGGFKAISGNVNQVQKFASQQDTNTDEGFWISKQQFDQFTSISGELLTMKNFFNMIQQNVNFRLQPELFERRQNDFAQDLSKICDQFQRQVHTVRKEKVSVIFRELAVLVRQTSAELNKNVKLELVGGEILIDKGLGKDLYEAFVHIVRNSIDHGIEDQFERALQGKPATGSLTLEISEHNNKILVIYKDDGKGLDSAKILQKMIESGLISAENGEKLTPQEIYRFIFNAGFSTKEKVTTLSGRGVGMDVVHSVVEKYQGSISIENTPGSGVCFRMEMATPQNTMVENALLCSWNKLKFAIPLTSVIQITSCNEMQFTTVNHLRYCQFNGFTVALLNYQEMLELKKMVHEATVKNSSAVFIRFQEGTIALMVDKVESKTDFVVKNFSKLIGLQKGCKGVSILADEDVVYVLDPEELGRHLFSSGIPLERAVA